MKNVLITGASGHLGKACTIQFASEGYHVIAMVSPGKKLQYKVDGEVSEYRADLTDEADVDRVMSQIIPNHKRIDAALLLVGGFAMGSIQDTDSLAIQKMLTLNFETAYFMARRLFNHMNEQGSGRLVFAGSKPALDPIMGKSALAYALSKSLIFKLAEMLNAEGSNQNVISTVVVPGIIDTPGNRSTMPDSNFTAWVKPSEIASIISFISSDHANALREPILKIYGKA